MSLAPLLAASSIIQWHAFAALAALVLSAYQFFAPPGSLLHRALGRVWVALMGFVALSSFWIHDLRMVGPFSVIHLLSLYVLAQLVRGVLAARAGRIEEHRSTMRGLVLYGLIVAGLFTLMPGRIMHAVVSG